MERGCVVGGNARGRGRSEDSTAIALHSILVVVVDDYVIMSMTR